MAKRKERKPKSGVKVRAKVKPNASIREFYDAIIANLDAAYWTDAEPVLSGSVPKDDYPAAASRLETLKEAAQIVRRTLLAVDQEEREDEKERQDDDKEGA